jgi:ABC-2 type transport system ATP-binding protein
MPPKKSEVEEALGKVDGVKKVGELPTDERAHAYELVSEQEVDLRPEVFKLVVDKGWVLLELHRDAQTLEDVFRNLTIGDERRNRHLPTEGEESDETERDEDNEEDDADDEPEQGADSGADEKVAKADRS